VSRFGIMGKDDDRLAQAVELLEHPEAELLQAAHHDVANQIPHAQQRVAPQALRIRVGTRFGSPSDQGPWSVSA